MSRTSASSLSIAFTPFDDSVEGKNPGRVAAGLKASIHNPNVSDEAKQSATERLHDMGADVDDAPSVQHAGEPCWILTLCCPHLMLPTTAGSNTRSKGADIVDDDEDMLQDVDEDEEELQHASGGRATGGASRKTTSGKNEDNVIRGYKATLHSEFDVLLPQSCWCLMSRIDPRVGDEAKERAQEYLEEHDAA